MLKASAQRNDTRTGILDAAFATLREEGFGGASARAIARRGGFNQSLVFYHFGSVNGLLLAALDRVAGERMERYRELLSDVRDPAEVIRRMRLLYEEDRESGHSTVLAEMFAASSAAPELREQLMLLMGPWIDFTTGLLADFFAGTPLEHLVDARTAAQAFLAAYIGIDVLSHLDGDGGRAAAIFDAGDRLAAFAGAFLGGDRT